MPTALAMRGALKACPFDILQRVQERQCNWSDTIFASLCPVNFTRHNKTHRQTSNIRRAVVGNKQCTVKLLI